MRYLQPDLVARSVHDVDYDALRRRGIRALFYDLENTLCRWRGWELDARTVALLQSLRKREMQIAVLTNAWVPPDHSLVRELGEMGIPVVASARKPFRRSFRRTLALLGVGPRQAAMIGDQLLTDVLGGKRSGLYTVLVDPLRPEESRPTKVNRWVERLLGRARTVASLKSQVRLATCDLPTCDCPSALLARLGLDLPEEVLRAALTHDSYANESGGASNERLEFLGDAVLDLAVADMLYRLFPDRDEGDLSKLRAVVVSRPVLAEVAKGLGLGEFLLLGKGAEEGGGRTRPSVLAAAFEAVIGAAFLHHGYGGAQALAERLLQDRAVAYAVDSAPDYKSLLQELGQARFGTLPHYEVLAAEGPEHKKVFTVRASLPTGQAPGRGRSKKEAEQAAAKRLYVRLAEEAGD